MLNLKDQLVVALSRQGQNWNPFTLLETLSRCWCPRISQTRDLSHADTVTPARRSLSPLGWSRPLWAAVRRSEPASSARLPHCLWDQSASLQYFFAFILLFFFTLLRAVFPSALTLWRFPLWLLCPSPHALSGCSKKRAAPRASQQGRGFPALHWDTNLPNLEETLC